MNDEELFPAESVAMDSPKLAWMKRHGVITFYYSSPNCEPTWFAGFHSWWPYLKGLNFFAEETGHNGDSRVGEGVTEDDAIASLLTCGEAREKGINLWNEEAIQ